MLAAVTFFNAKEVLALSARHTALRTQMDADRARAAEFRQRAARLRAELKQEDLERVLAETREANELIDQRTFSWTELFNHLEVTLPPEVMLRAVQPQIRDGQMTVTLGIVGRRVDDIESFMERLERTGAFRDLLATSESPQEDGSLNGTVVGVYSGARTGRTPEATATSTSKATPAGREARR